MTYYDIVEQVKSESRFENDPNADTMIERTVNRLYRSYSERQMWRELTVWGETFDTTQDTQNYVAPYILQNIIPDTALYNFDSSSQTGELITVINDMRIAQRTTWFSEGTVPGYMMVNGTVGTALYDTGSATVANEATSVTGVGTAWTTAMEGEYIAFGYSATNTASGANYGYLIDTVSSGTALTLAEGYRGAALTQAQYAIRPAQTPQIRLTPSFTEYGKTIKYSYVRTPRRLYNSGDTMEVQALGDVIVSETIAFLCGWSNDLQRQGMYTQRAREQYASLTKQYAF